MGEQIDMFGLAETPQAPVSHNPPERPVPPCCPAERLHRIHAAPASGLGGASLDVDGLRWRGDGPAANKPAIARRMAVCWNVCEGFPTEALEQGVLLRVAEATDVLLLALQAESSVLPGRIAAAAEALRQASARADAALDTRHGRLHDCEPCLGLETNGVAPTPTSTDDESG